MPEADKAFSLDGDGVLFFRPPVQAAIFKAHVDLPGVSSGIPSIQREVLGIPIALREYPSYFIHRLKFVYPEVRRSLLLLEDSDSYLNTGRLNTKPWFDLTMLSMKRARILDYFKGFYFRPRGLPTSLSKLAVVAELKMQYEEVTHFDDNPLDGIPIARHFPDVRVVIIKDWSTGLLLRRLGIELDQFPNVSIARNLREAILASQGLTLQSSKL